MGMVELSEETQKRVKKLFSPELQVEATKTLENECGTNLPFCRNHNKYELERIRFSALKVSGGDIERLKESVELAKVDWRDLLMAAGFAEDTEAHKHWMADA